MTNHIRHDFLSISFVTSFTGFARCACFVEPAIPMGIDFGGGHSLNNSVLRNRVYELIDDNGSQPQNFGDLRLIARQAIGADIRSWVEESHRKSTFTVKYRKTERGLEIIGGGSDGRLFHEVFIDRVRELGPQLGVSVDEAELERLEQIEHALLNGTSQLITAAGKDGAIRYLQEWQQQKDGTVVMRSFDIAAKAGRDLTQTEASRTIRHSLGMAKSQVLDKDKLVYKIDDKQGKKDFFTKATDYVKSQTTDRIVTTQFRETLVSQGRNITSKARQPDNWPKTTKGDIVQIKPLFKPEPSRKAEITLLNQSRFSNTSSEADKTAKQHQRVETFTKRVVKDSFVGFWAIARFVKELKQRRKSKSVYGAKAKLTINVYMSQKPVRREAGIISRVRIKVKHRLTPAFTRVERIIKRASLHIIRKAESINRGIKRIVGKSREFGRGFTQYSKVEFFRRLRKVIIKEKLIRLLFQKNEKPKIRVNLQTKDEITHSFPIKERLKFQFSRISRRLNEPVTKFIRPLILIQKQIEERLSQIYFKFKREMSSIIKTRIRVKAVEEFFQLFKLARFAAKRLLRLKEVRRKSISVAPFYRQIWNRFTRFVRPSHSYLTAPSQKPLQESVENERSGFTLTVYLYLFWLWLRVKIFKAERPMGVAWGQPRTIKKIKTRVKSRLIYQYLPFRAAGSLRVSL